MYHFHLWMALILDMILIKAYPQEDPTNFIKRNPELNFFADIHYFAFLIIFIRNKCVGYFMIRIHVCLKCSRKLYTCITDKFLNNYSSPVYCQGGTNANAELSRRKKCKCRDCNCTQNMSII